MFVLVFVRIVFQQPKPACAIRAFRTSRGAHVGTGFGREPLVYAVAHDIRAISVTVAESPEPQLALPDPRFALLRPNIGGNVRHFIRADARDGLHIAKFPVMRPHPIFCR